MGLPFACGSQIKDADSLRQDNATALIGLDRTTRQLCLSIFCWIAQFDTFVVSSYTASSPLRRHACTRRHDKRRTRVVHASHHHGNGRRVGKNRSSLGRGRRGRRPSTRRRCCGKSCKYSGKFRFVSRDPRFRAVPRFATAEQTRWL